ncbi:MAG: biotin/lipoyl-binding protein [Bacteroidales bacterium]|nr:biotin/lipoyl-binding protein [Bacteroidales bacterium]
MKNFKFSIHGNEYVVDVIDVENNIAHLEVNGTPYEVEIHKKVKESKTPRIIVPVAKEPSKPEIQKRDEGDAHPIAAPLPGTILKVHVKSGDIISKGQVLLVMEAMKMENQVLADRNGVIETVDVKEGDTVLQGDTLMKLI